MGFFTFCTPATAPARRSLAVHQAGIHLVLAIGIEHRTATSVEERRILQGTHGRFHRVQRGTALLQYGMTAA
jgi:hypothetical protein